MNIELLKQQIRQIESRHDCPVASCAEVFQFIRELLHHVMGPVDPEFKRELRRALDRAYERAGAARSKLMA